MQNTFRIRFDFSQSGNRESKIENRKLAGLLAFVVTFAMCGDVATAQQSKKIHRIGYLSNSDAASESARSEGIRLARRERGYIEAQNVATEYRYTEGKTRSAP